MGGYLAAWTFLCIETNWITIGLPFLILFSIGFFYVGLTTLAGRWVRAHTAAEEQDPAVAALRPVAQEPAEPRA